MSGLLGADGKPMQDPRTAPCPQCGAGPDKRTPSGGFGEVYLVCTGKGCAHEFKELKCHAITS